MITTGDHGCRRSVIVLIGPLPPGTKDGAIAIGGGAVNFAEMIRQLRNRNFDLELVDSSRPRTDIPQWRVACRDVTKFLAIVIRVVRVMRRSQIVFLNTSVGRAWISASLMWIICRSGNRSIVIRFFGGDLALQYGSYAALKRWWVDKTYMRADLLFVQTEAVYRAVAHIENIRWFPNTRDVRPSSCRIRKRIRKLLFLSRLYMDKGLRESVEACRALRGDCHLNVYGPVMPDTDLSLFTDNCTVTYRGVLTPAEVPKVLSDHDVLLLPTYWASEGYPGVLLEAFQCGIPVIATRWAGIPEIVEDEISGLLVEPRSASAVRAAVERLISDPDLYRSMCDGALRRGEFFRSAAWYDRMADDLRRLGAGRA